MANSIPSGQSSVDIDVDKVIKTFNEQSEFEQEKYFLTLLNQKDIQFTPQILSFNNQDLSITMNYLGVQIGEETVASRKDEILSKLSEKMDPVWQIEENIASEYNYEGDKGFDYVYRFLSKEYDRVLSDILGDYEIKELQEWLKNTFDLLYKRKDHNDCLIHFDLSPRNVLIKDGELFVVDWSRCIRADLIIEAAIIREKFSHIGESKDIYKETKMFELDFGNVDMLANAFSVYRKAKKVGKGLSIEAYKEFLNGSVL